MEVVSNSALRITPAHLAQIAALAEDGEIDEMRRALFDLVGQIRGERPGAAPTLRVIAGG
jgi:O-antigen biosynthesis protein WbqV